MQIFNRLYRWGIGAVFLMIIPVSLHAQLPKNKSGFWTYPAATSKVYVNAGAIVMLNYFRFDLPKYAPNIAPQVDFGFMVNRNTAFQVGLMGYHVKRTILLPNNKEIKANTALFEFPILVKFFVPTKQYRYRPYALTGLSFCYSDFKYDTTRVAIDQQFKKHDTFLAVSFGAQERVRSRLSYFYQVGFRHSMTSLFKADSSRINYRTHFNISFGFLYIF
jgi:hypothetical protein